MDLSTLMLEKGADIQVWVFFGCLAALLALERVVPCRPIPADRWVRWRTNASLSILNVVLIGLLPISLVAAGFWAERHEIGLLNWLEAPYAVVLASTLLLRGFVSFFTHFLNHKLPLLWRLHRVHHLDDDLDVSSTVRFHPLEMIVGTIIGIPLILLMGLAPWALLLYELLDAAVTLFSHSNIRLPRWLNRPLRYVIVTPDLHRVHHSARQPETDSNYGAVFPLWDLIFGTFRAQASAPSASMALGLGDTDSGARHDLRYLLCAPFRRLHGAAAAGHQTG